MERPSVDNLKNIYNKIYDFDTKNSWSHAALLAAPREVLKNKLLCLKQLMIDCYVYNIKYLDPTFTEKMPPNSQQAITCLQIAGANNDLLHLFINLAFHPEFKKINTDMPFWIINNISAIEMKKMLESLRAVTEPIIKITIDNQPLSSPIME